MTKKEKSVFLTLNQFVDCRLDVNQTIVVGSFLDNHARLTIRHFYIPFHRGLHDGNFLGNIILWNIACISITYIRIKAHILLKLQVLMENIKCSIENQQLKILKSTSYLTKP